MTSCPEPVETDPDTVGPVWPIPPAHRQAIVDVLLAIAYADADTGRRIEAVRLLIEMDRSNLMAAACATLDPTAGPTFLGQTLRLIAAA